MSEHTHASPLVLDVTESELRALVSGATRTFPAIEAIARPYGVTAAELVLQADAAAGHQISPEQWMDTLRRLADWLPRVRRTGKRPAGTWASRRRWGW